MTVAFSDDMVTSNLSYLNSSSIRISIKSLSSLESGGGFSQGQTFGTESENLSHDSISFTWEPVSLSDNLFRI